MKQEKIGVVDMKKVLIGVILSAILVYLSLRGIHFRSVGEVISHVYFPYVLLALLLIFIIQVLRSIRWGLILKDIVKVDLFTLFSITSVGFLAIVAIPARLGELARPFLISRKKNISMSAALGTIFVERILDMITILLIGIITLPMLPLSPWLIRSIFIMVVIMALAVIGLWLIIRKRNILEQATFPLPLFIRKKYETEIRNLISHFIDGLAAIKDRKKFVQVVLLSLCIWIINGLSIYVLFMAFGYSLPFWAAFILMFILILGIAIPTAPGFVGNWHFACVATLTLLFQLGKDDALSFAILYHALSIGMLLIMGLAFLPANRFSLNKLTSHMTSKANE